MTRTLLATAAALILTAASFSTADAAPRGGGGGGFSGGGFSGGGFSRGGSMGGFSGGFSRGGSPGGFAAGGFSRGGASVGGGMTPFRGGMAAAPANQFRGNFQGPVSGPQFGGFTGNRFVGGNRFAGGRNFRHFRTGSVVAFGSPFFYDDYGYGYDPYDTYPYDDSCYVTRRVWSHGHWRYVQAYACEY